MTEVKERLADDSLVSLDGLLGLCSRNTRLISCIAALGVGASIAVLALKAPSYRAKATLILEGRESAGGLLGELATLGRAPQAASEIEILRARTTVESTVSEPASSEPLERERHLGLTTLVEDRELAPLRPGATTRRADEPRLHARLASRDASEPIERLEVEFLAIDRVRVARTGWFAFGGGEEFTLAQTPIESADFTLSLTPEGDLTGREFEIVQLTTDEAVRRVMDATRVRETERNSGVIELYYDDSDPRRAADVANALCRNYFDRNQRRGERKASQTLEFIEAQLATQTEQLHAAEREVVELQGQNPRAINVAKSSEALIDEVSALEVRRVQLQLAVAALRRALELLSAGDVEALGRLSTELADPITAVYVEGIAKLAAEHELQDRSDAGAYKALLQQHTLELEAQRDQLALTLQSAQAVLDSVTRGDAGAIARLGGGPPSARDALLEGYLQDLAQLESQAATLARDFTDSHPDRTRVAGSIASVRERILGLLRTRVDGLRAQALEHGQLLASYRGRTEDYPEHERERIETALTNLRARTATHLHSRLSGLEGEAQSVGDAIARVEASLGVLPEEERRLADPLRRLSAHSEIVKFLLSRQQESEIARASTLPSADFIDSAVAPLERHAPSIPLHVAAGAILGLAAALALAYAKESLSRGVFTAAELEEATSLPVFGSIPDFRSGRFKVKHALADFVPMRDDPEGPVAEAYRSLRANLKFALTGEREIRTLAITSCSQGEGKSLAGIDLALSFARTGKRVAVVDCDMRRPSVHQFLALELSPGLSDVLQNKVAWRECVRREVEAHLDVISAGAQPRNPSDLLAGREFDELLGELSREYDLVIVDVPPVLAVSDIESVAPRLDALLLLCRSNKVSSDVVAAAARRLRQVGANLIGTVLNAVGTSLVHNKYGYGYGYGYGYTQRSQPREHERRAG